MVWKDYFGKVEGALRYLRGGVSAKPKLALVLSGGLGKFADRLKGAETVLAGDIPNYPHSRVEGHKGELVFGNWDRFPVVALKGRTHYYEGWSPQEVVFPCFVLQALGVETWVTTNAVGGIRLDLDVGDVMVVTDHINMMGTNPLIGLTIQKPNDQFISLQKAYDPKLIQLAKEVAKAQKLKLREGVYLANPGPSYETPAEIKAYRQLGADSVGMSTLFEVIAANYLKMRVLALNIIANPSADRHGGEMTHEEVLESMRKSEAKVVRFLEGVVSAIGKLS